MSSTLRFIVADMRGAAQFVDDAGPKSYREALNAFADRIEEALDMEAGPSRTTDPRHGFDHCLKQAVRESHYQDHVGWLVRAIRLLRDEVHTLKHKLGKPIGPPRCPTCKQLLDKYSSGPDYHCQACDRLVLGWEVER